MGAKNPNDSGENAKIILPGVKQVMGEAMLNFVVSGCSTPESEAQNFEPEQVIARFTWLMGQLPIHAVAF